MKENMAISIKYLNTGVHVALALWSNSKNIIILLFDYLTI